MSDRWDSNYGDPYTDNYFFYRYPDNRLTIRQMIGQSQWNIYDIEQGNAWDERPIIAGPFESLEDAQAAYLMLI